MMKAKIEKILQETFQPQYLYVQDDSAKHIGHAGAREGGHYSVVMTSSVFKGVRLIDRHRMVYDALKPLKGQIHAIAMTLKEE